MGILIAIRNVEQVSNEIYSSFSRYINTMRKQFGINAECILEALFHHGKITASQLIVASYRNSESKVSIVVND